MRCHLISLFFLSLVVFAFSLVLDPKDKHPSKEKQPSSVVVQTAIAQSYDHMLQQAAVPAQFISNLINDLGGDNAAAQLRVARFLVMVSGWASLDSMNQLMNQLARDEVIVDGKGASLGDFLLYLSSKGHWQSHTVLKEVSNVEKSASGALLADPIMLRRLRDVPNFQKQLVNNPKDFALILPFGYECVNPFNLRLVSELVEKWLDGLPPAKMLDNEASEEEHADEVQLLKTHIEERTRELIPSDLRDVPVRFVYPRFNFFQSKGDMHSFMQMSVNELVSEYLVKHFGTPLPTELLWRTLFDIYEDEPATQLSIAKTLKSAGLFLGTNWFSEATLKLTEMIASALREFNNERDEDSGVGPDSLHTAQFVIPKEKKSYGFAAMVFFINNPDLSTALLCRAYDGAPDKKRAWVILDDFAGSGESLGMTARQIALQVPGVRFVLAPFLLTAEAKTRFTNLKTHYDVKMAAALEMSEAHRPEWREWMGATGYTGGNYFVSFPHMSPDNDCAFMSFLVASLLTFEGRGVKIRRNTPEPPRLRQFLRLKNLRVQPTFPLEEFSFFEMCPGKFPVQVWYTNREPVHVHTDSAALCAVRSNALFNWVLTNDDRLVFNDAGLSFGPLADNPLELGASHLELADATRALDGVVGMGRVLVAEKALRFYVVRPMKATHVQEVVQEHMRLHPCKPPRPVSFRADVKIPAPRSAVLKDFVAACDAGYVVKFSWSDWEEKSSGTRPLSDDACEFLKTVDVTSLCGEISPPPPAGPGTFLPPLL